MTQVLARARPGRTREPAEPEGASPAASRPAALSEILKAMPQENVEIVRRALKARRREFPALFDPAVRLDLSERVFNPGAYHDHERALRDAGVEG